jgi:hypothetical protein
MKNVKESFYYRRIKINFYFTFEVGILPKSFTVSKSQSFLGGLLFYIVFAEGDSPYETRGTQNIFEGQRI